MTQKKHLEYFCKRTHGKISGDRTGAYYCPRGGASPGKG